MFPRKSSRSIPSRPFLDAFHTSLEFHSNWKITLTPTGLANHCPRNSWSQISDHWCRAMGKLYFELNEEVKIWGSILVFHLHGCCLELCRVLNYMKNYLGILNNKDDILCFTLSDRERIMVALNIFNSCQLNDVWDSNCFSKGIAVVPCIMPFPSVEVTYNHLLIVMCLPNLDNFILPHFCMIITIQVPIKQWTSFISSAEAYYTKSFILIYSG